MLGCEKAAEAVKAAKGNIGNSRRRCESIMPLGRLALPHGFARQITVRGLWPVQGLAKTGD